MRETIFQLIIAKLQSLNIFSGEDGTLRVYTFPTASPAGYPYAVLSSDSMESSVLDSQRDSRRFIYSVQVVGEKFGVEGGMSQEDALSAMRATEDLVLAAIDSDNDLGNGNIVRTLPLRAVYGVTDGGTRVVLTLTMSVEITVNISY